MLCTYRGSSNVPNVIIDKGGDSDDDDTFVTKEEEPQESLEPEPVSHLLIFAFTV